MSLKAKIFIGLMITVGILVLFRVAIHPVWIEPLHFFTYLGLILLASGMKVTIPRTDGNGTMSVNFVFILLAFMQLTLAEAMVAGCLSVLVQCLFKVRKGFRPIQIAFNTANIAAAIFLASFTYQQLLHFHAPLGIALALASAVYFLANTAPVATILAWEQGRPVLSLWFDTFNWYLPFYLFGAVIASVIQFITLRYGWPTSLLIFPAAWAVYVSYRNYLERLQEQKKHIGQMADLHLRTIETLALAIEAKDQNTHDHLCRVRVYAYEVGKELGLDAQQMEALRAAALLHDIGKLAVPEHIINKPGKLTPEEFEKMKIHPVVGAEILERVNFPYPVTPIVRSHHERWDGKGYPDGLAGESIPIGARILTAVDCLDALATDRPYRRALSLSEAMTHVRQLSGTQFDPRIVEVLDRRCEELETMARKEGAAMAPLNVHIKVKRGDEPGAGFESNGMDALLSPNIASSVDVELSVHATEAVLELAKTLDGSLSLDETLSKFASNLKRVIAFDTLAVYIRHGNHLLPKFVTGEDEHLFSSLKIPLGEGLSGWVAQNRLPIVNGNPSVEPGYLNDTTKYSKLRSALAVPLENPQGEILGTLVLYAVRGDAFTRDNLILMQEIGPHLSLSIENAIRYHLTETQTTTDFLTKALNSRAFFARLQDDLKRCAAGNQPLSLLICDMDSFKQVNEQFGHVEANRLLSHLAECFRGTIREGDSLARTGGDELALVFPGLDARTAEARIRDLRAAIRTASLDIFADQHQATASLGLACFPQDGATAEDLMAAADRELKSAKRLRSTRPERPVSAPLAVARG